MLENVSNLLVGLGSLACGAGAFFYGLAAFNNSRRPHKKRKRRNGKPFPGAPAIRGSRLRFHSSTSIMKNRNILAICITAMGLGLLASRTDLPQPGRFIAALGCFALGVYGLCSGYSAWEASRHA